ncbi:flagellar biosynthetic protein FliR [Marivita sp.]|uniref:flagellar biosynthetic protein FliR n=1 Tax=Marivita sp. TaxID=2003365 RepID=UPI00321ACB02
MIGGFLEEISAQFWLVSAVFLRIGPAMYLAPGYGESYVSARMRLSVAGMFAVAIAPVLAPYLPVVKPTGAEFLKYMLRESTIGFFIGLMSRGMIYLLEKAGTIISQSISLSQMLGNATEPMPVIGHLLTTAGIAILFSTSLADQMLYSFGSSYHVEMPSMGALTGYFASKVTELVNFIFNHAVVLASAFLSVMFVYYLCIGFINKAMPQFMVSFIGIPFVALFSIHFLYQHHELLLDVWQQKVRIILMLPYGTLP